VHERQQRVRLDREGARRRLHEPSAPHAPQLSREGDAIGRRDVLDHARAVHEIELAVGERQARGRVRAHERAGIPGLLGDVHTRDIECWLQRSKAQPTAADVEDARVGREAGEREEALVSPPARPCGQRRGDARERVRRAGVDILAVGHVCGWP